MKTCPNCGELLGTHAENCFKCKFDFTIGRVITREEQENKRQYLEEQKRKEEEERKEKEEKLREFERKKREREEEIQKERLDFIQKLPLYEYATEVIMDTRRGGINQELLAATLEKYAKLGWRLHTALTNEAGKNATSIGYGGVSVGTNATMDQTVLIFERMLSKGSL